MTRHPPRSVVAVLFITLLATSCTNKVALPARRRLVSPSSVPASTTSSDPPVRTASPTASAPSSTGPTSKLGTEAPSNSGARTAPTTSGTTAPPVPTTSPTPGIPTATHVVTPASEPVPVLAAPGGTQVATLPTITFGAPTWVPVLASQPGWYQVQLAGPPNGQSGWIPEGSVNAATTPYLIVVSLSGGQLTIYDAGRRVLVTPAAVGAPATPTPPGRTYLAGDVAPIGIDADLAPAVRPLGWHTTTPSAQAEFLGGTTAIHGWGGEETDPALWAEDGHGRAVSHGCIRLPASAARAVALIPNGSPVWIDA